MLLVPLQGCGRCPPSGDSGTIVVLAMSDGELVEWSVDLASHEVTELARSEAVPTTGLDFIYWWPSGADGDTADGASEVWEARLSQWDTRSDLPLGKELRGEATVPLADLRSSADPLVIDRISFNSGAFTLPSVGGFELSGSTRFNTWTLVLDGQAPAKLSLPSSVFRTILLVGENSLLVETSEGEIYCGVISDNCWTHVGSGSNVAGVVRLASDQE